MTIITTNRTKQSASWLAAEKGMHVYHPSAHAAVAPDKAAIIMVNSGEVVSYRTLDERSKQLAQLWHSRGIREGDHVALFMENHPSIFEVYWAAMRSGLYLTTVNSYLTTDEAQYIVDNCDAKVFVSSARLADVATQVLRESPKVEVAMMVDGVEGGFESYEHALEGSPADALDHEPLGVTMLYSSGSTGRPKGIKRLLTGRTVDEGHPTFLPLVQDVYAMSSDTIYLNPAPLYHSAPLLFSAAVTALGGTVVVMEKWDSEQILAAIERYEINTAQFVPTMFVRMLKLPAETRSKYRLESLKMVVHGAAPCPVEVKRQMIDWLGPVIYEYYAGTEDNGATLIDSFDWLEHPGSVGRALPGCVIHICDEAGVEVSTGEVGTIFFESSLVAAAFEYHGEPGRSATAKHPEHPTWTTLGDVGRLDSEGYLYLTDRKAHMIISGGVNIYPQEIEQALITHPAVLDIAVFGVPNEEFGEEVKAVVQPADLKRDHDEMEREILDFARTKLAGFKCPRTVDFIDDFPRLPTGKLYKQKLREKYWAGHESHVI
jgi:long-chain acyl-CoA synthetase